MAILEMLEESKSSRTSGWGELPGGSIIWARSLIKDAAGCGISMNKSKTHVVSARGLSCD